MEDIKIDIEVYLNEWFTLKEIQWIKEAEEDIIKWNVISEKELKHFIKNDLFGKYTMNA